MTTKEDTFFYQNGTTTYQFSGELITHVSSELPSKDRWTEFDLFLSTSDEWILQGIGRTRIETEQDRYWAVASMDVADVLAAVIGSDVSRLAKKLLALSLQNLAGLGLNAE